MNLRRPGLFIDMRTHPAFPALAVVEVPDYSWDCRRGTLYPRNVGSPSGD